MPNRIWIALANLSLTVAAAVLVALLPVSGVRLAAVTWLIFVGPGLALVLGWARADYRLDGAEFLSLAAALSLSAGLLGALKLFAVLGSLTLPALLAWLVAVTLAGSAAAFFHRNEPLPLSLPARRDWSLVAVLAVSAMFCFGGLAYADWRGDEAEVLMRSLAVLAGQGQPLLTHTKGPAEILLAAVTGLLAGSFDELTVRLPFAVTSWLVVWAVFALGRRMAGRRAGLLAAVLMLLNGWLLSHAHTAQYQPILMLTTTLAVWSYWQFRRGLAPVFLWTGVTFLAVAALTHYDGAAVGLPVLALLGETLFGPNRRRDGQPWRAVVLSLGAGAIVVLAFYGPFVAFALRGETGGYLSKHIGTGQPYNNWGLFYIDWLTNNAPYYLAVVGGTVLAGVWFGIKRLVAGRWATLASLTAVGALVVAVSPWAGGWLSLAIVVGLGATFAFGRRTSPEVKLLLGWLAVPVIIYLFLIFRPRDHYYIFMPPLALLTALLLDAGLAGLARRGWAAGLSAALAVLLALSAWNQVALFVRTDLETMLTWPRHKNPVLVNDPRFPFKVRIGWGFPYRLGWQTVSELFRDGTLAGDWYANDAGNSITWYTRGSVQNPCFPRYFMLADYTYKEPSLPVPTQTIEPYYALRYTVRVHGEPRLRVFEFSPEGDGIPPQIFDEPAATSPYPPELFNGDPLAGPIFRPQVAFDAPRRFKPHPDMLAQLVDVYNDPNTVLFQEDVSLLGYDLDTSRARPGGMAILTLYWRADSAVFLPYKIFTHVESDRLWAQADDEPACATSPTYTWQAGDQIIDRHVIFLPADMPPGEYPLQVGLYEIRSGLRMDTLDGAGNPAGNSLLLTTLAVE